MKINFFSLKIKWICICFLIFFTTLKSLSAGSYEAIDRWALATPKSAEESIDTLAAYLIKPAQNDLEKVRAIFRWVAENIVYDTEGYFRGSAAGQTLEESLKNKTAICEGYSGLLESLLKAAGSEVVKIDGYGKGYNYLAGTSFSGPPNHAWNAVKIDKNWYLLDSTWGAGYVDENQRFVKKFEEHFFLTSAEDFIYDHWPFESGWQLLKNPLTKTEFENLIYLRPAFFNYRLKLLGASGALVSANERTAIKIAAPEDILFTAHLEENGRKLKGQFIFIQKDKNESEILAAFPHSGSYYLRIFAKRKNENIKFQWAAEFKIEAQVPAENIAPACPKAFDDFYLVAAYLWQPLAGSLKAGTKEIFKLKIPGAEKAAVVVGKRFVHLKKSGEVFEGLCLIEPGEVEIFAKFPGEKDYRAVLAYQGK